uniref:Uncharacterized protein n=1 Tax=Spongospora subterranea TaxID=70186 RepID=A0A0H5RB77_9EUKA|eukprot:CRZ11460.1 hypothetical protein [Spongospora subterranea]
MPAPDFLAAIAAVREQLIRVSIAGRPGVLVLQRDMNQASLVFSLFDGRSIRRSMCSESLLTTHKREARLDVEWNVLFKLLNDSFAADEHISIDYDEDHDLVTISITYGLGGDISVKGYINLDDIITDEIGPTLLQLMESQADKAKLLTLELTHANAELARCKAVELSKASHQPAGADSGAVIERNLPARPPPNRPKRRLKRPELVPKGTKIKEGF